MKKNICLVQWITGGQSGGEKVAVNLANELSEFHNVHLVGITSETESLFFELSNKVNYITFIKGKPKLSKVFLKVTNQLRSYLKKHDIDVVMAIGMSSFAFTVISAIGTRAKVITCEHLNSIIPAQKKTNLINRYVGAKFSDILVVLTNKDRDNYISRYHLNPEKVQTVYNWSEPIEYFDKYNVDSRKIVTVGRLSSQKGFEYLMEVATAILSQYPDWKWYIYGSGEESIKNNLLNFIEENELEDQLILAGLEEDLNKVYGDKALFVMTSRFEGLPLVLLEAKQYHLPIISFECPTGPSEIVSDQVNGFLVDPYDIETMSKKIIELIQDENLRISFAENAMKDTEKFDKKIILKQWNELITSL